MRSFARQGYGGLNFWMKGGTPRHELERAWYLARKKIADVRHEFPDGVRGPFFNDEFTDVYSVLYAFSAPELSWPELQVQVEDAKRQLQAVPGVTKIDVFGRQAEKVYVEFTSARLAALGIEMCIRDSRCPSDSRSCSGFSKRSRLSRYCAKPWKQRRITSESRWSRLG